MNMSDPCKIHGQSTLHRPKHSHWESSPAFPHIWCWQVSWQCSVALAHLTGLQQPYCNCCCLISILESKLDFGITSVPVCNSLCITAGLGPIDIVVEGSNHRAHWVSRTIYHHPNGTDQRPAVFSSTYYKVAIETEHIRTTVSNNSCIYIYIQHTQHHICILKTEVCCCREYCVLRWKNDVAGAVDKGSYLKSS